MATRAYAERHHRFDDGYETLMRSWGDPGGPEPVLILHGLLGHSGMFEGLGRGLSERANVTCFAYDRRGAGRCTELRGDSPGIDRTVEDVVHAARTIGGGRPVHLLAWCGSFGFAAPAIQRAPEMFRSLTLLAPLFAGCEGPVPREAMGRFWGRAAGKQPNELIEGPGFFPYLVDAAHRDEMVRDELILRQITPRLPTLFLDAVEAAAEIAPKLDLPKSVMIARNDEIIDSSLSKPYAERMLGADKVIEIDGPHATWWHDVNVIADNFARTALAGAASTQRRPAELQPAP